jgi:hypothetical protein
MPLSQATLDAEKKAIRVFLRALKAIAWNMAVFCYSRSISSTGRPVNRTIFSTGSPSDFI